MGVSRLWAESASWGNTLIIAAAGTVLLFLFPPSCSKQAPVQTATQGTTTQGTPAQTTNGQGNAVSASPPTPPIPGAKQGSQTGVKVIGGPSNAVKPVAPPPKIKPGIGSDSITVEENDDGFGSINSNKRN